jgi:ankyrin repeat protein
MAINRGDHAGVQALLKRGADPNARNALEFTPLVFAAATGQVPVVEMLLHAGAKLNAPSPFGTSLTFAALGGSAPVMKLLLARGADVNAHRADGISVLMMASRYPDAAIIGELLRRKAAVNAKDNDGATALIYAAREGHLDVARALLGGGAAVDAADSHGWTALSYAAVNGHADLVKVLLEKGANVNARDTKRRTPLILATTYGDYPAVIQALTAGGADLQATDAQGRTAAALALARGRAESAQMLRATAAAATVAAGGASSLVPDTAIRASLTTLQRSMQAFSKNTGCISCHQDGLGRMATGEALARGIAIDPAVARAQMERIRGALTELRPLHQQALKDPAAMKNLPLIEIGELTPGYAFMLAGVVAHKEPANEAITATTMVLARQQFPDGHWQFSFPRVPMQSSFFTVTALAVQALQTYAPKERAAEAAERSRRARGWLLKTPAQSGEDRAFRLLGLKWAGASVEERRKAIDELLAAQRPDGGWSQMAAMPSDAYATGEALYALRVAGELPVTDPVYQRGTQFLLRTQEEDGSWFVAKRAMPANNYFDAEFPHGESQYASFNATCWAAMALMQSVDRPRRAAR